MYTNYLATEDRPTAFITVNKRRIKQFYKDVYLADQTEFEIELFNPTTSKVLAEIELNGKNISDSGIIIKPGQRIFLERFIDDNRKFKFETYEVAATEEVKKATRYNGDVTVKFFRQQQQHNHITIATNNPYLFNGSTTGYNYNQTFTTNSINLSNTWDGTVTCSDNFSTPTPTLSYCSSTPTSTTLSKDITGSVEMGGESQQKFTTSYDRFESAYTWVSYWKINPMEKKPIESKDLVKYCTTCSNKIKNSSWKYCPACGTEIEKEVDLASLSKEELIKLLQTIK